MLTCLVIIPVSCLLSPPCLLLSFDHCLLSFIYCIVSIVFCFLSTGSCVLFTFLSVLPSIDYSDLSGFIWFKGIIWVSICFLMILELFQTEQNTWNAFHFIQKGIICFLINPYSAGLSVFVWSLQMQLQE